MLPRVRTREPGLLTIPMLARQAGIAPSTVRWLAAQKVVRPQLSIEHPGHKGPMRLFQPQDVQVILNYYRERGGIRSLPNQDNGLARPRLRRIAK